MHAYGFTTVSLRCCERSEEGFVLNSLRETRKGGGGEGMAGRQGSDFSRNLTTSSSLGGMGRLPAPDPNPAEQPIFPSPGPALSWPQVSDLTDTSSCSGI